MAMAHVNGKKNKRVSRALIDSLCPRLRIQSLQVKPAFGEPGQELYKVTASSLSPSDLLAPCPILYEAREECHNETIKGLSWQLTFSR
jgi:hypothetical protein